MAGPLETGERILLVDRRGRRFLVRLETGATFHFHGGAVPHDLIIGSPEGTMVYSETGKPVRCYRPRLADFVLKMSRGAQVIYPKDLGAILVASDVFPGARVLEAGTGSGALTLALARVIGTEGLLVSYEVRPDFHERAQQNLEEFLGKVPPWVQLRLGDVRAVGETGESFDRVVLDLPEPEAALGRVAPVLDPGGVLCGYLPTTGQVQSFVLALRASGFSEVETFEVLLRTWHVEERSVRPDHRMVAHTGFVVHGRKAA